MRIAMPWSSSLRRWSIDRDAGHVATICGLAYPELDLAPFGPFVGLIHVRRSRI